VTLDLGVCVLRPWRRGDEASLAQHADNSAVSRNLKDTFPHPYTLADAEAWIGRNVDAERLTNFAIIVDDAAVGGIGIIAGTDVDRRSAEIGYWLAEPYWGRGIATAALRAVTEWAFATFDLVRLQADVYEWNPASARVLEKAGYTLEGRQRKGVTKDGVTMDRLVYVIVREE
jgi:RimJ/RimL family protein N-acetyltransferase